jgi:hypothetical protein
MKKTVVTILTALTFLGIYASVHAAAYPSVIVGSSPVNGYYLQTNGTASTWAPVSGGGGNSFAFPFTPVSGGNATSTLLYLYNGLYSNAASSTIKYASSTALSATSLCLGTDCRQIWPTSDQTVSLSNGTGINVTGTYPNFTITNTAPDQTVSLTNGTNISITGTYPNFTINSTASGGSAFPFTPVAGGNATSTLLYLYNGLYATGSSTIQYASTTAITSSGSAYLATLGGNVGIGTASPAQKLTVSGNIYATGQVTAGTTETYGAGTFSGGTSFTGTPSYGIASVGSIIGTNWQGNGFLFTNYSRGATSFSMVYNGDKAYFGSLTSGASSPVAFGSWTSYGLSVGSFTNTNMLDVSGGIAAGSYAGTAAPSNGMIISGNVGIGTTSPWRALSVNGTSDLGTNALAGSFTATSTTATSTFANGLNLTGGCFEINGACFTGGTGTNYFSNSGAITTLNTGSQLAVPTNGWFSEGTQLLAYASSTNGDTIFGLGAGGQNATTSAMIGNNSAFGLNALYSNTTGTDNTAQGLNALFSNTTGYNNTAQGLSALYSNTTGTYNTAQGFQSLFSNTTGSYNTAQGQNALYSNTTGTDNTANGDASLYSNTTGSYNTAQGQNALFSNTTGTYNTAQGFQSLSSNTTGSYNTAQGQNALYSNTTGTDNTANGDASLYSNTTGSYNTAQGQNALFSNTTGTYNTAQGFQSLYSNTTASYNAAFGRTALFSNTTGSANTAVGGRSALYTNTTGASSTAIGYQTLFLNVSGNQNTALGIQAGYSETGSNNLYLGAYVGSTTSSGSNNITIGYDIATPSITSSNTLNIGNLIFGTGINGEGTNLSSGNVGIGTTSPASTLSVQGSGYISSNLFVGGAITSTSSAASTFPSASTTNASASRSFSIASKGVLNYRSPGFSYATTTWSGTTTQAQGQLPSPFTASTIEAAQCYTLAGTVNVDIYHTTTHLPLIVGASTTQGIYNFSSNNSLAAQEAWYWQAGTPATSPTGLTCTFKLTTIQSQ